MYFTDKDVINYFSQNNLNKKKKAYTFADVDDVLQSNGVDLDLTALQSGT